MESWTKVEKKKRSSTLNGESPTFPPHNETHRPSRGPRHSAGTAAVHTATHTHGNNTSSSHKRDSQETGSGAGPSSRPPLSQDHPPPRPRAHTQPVALNTSVATFPPLPSTTQQQQSQRPTRAPPSAAGSGAPHPSSFDTNPRPPRAEGRPPAALLAIVDEPQTGEGSPGPSPRPSTFQRGLSELLQIVYDVYDLCEAEAGGRGLAMARQTASILSDALEDFISFVADRSGGREGEGRISFIESGDGEVPSGGRGVDRGADDDEDEEFEEEDEEEDETLSSRLTIMSYAEVAKRLTSSAKQLSDASIHRLEEPEVDPSRPRSFRRSDLMEELFGEVGAEQIKRMVTPRPSSWGATLGLDLQDDLEDPNSATGTPRMEGGGTGTPVSLALKLMSPDRRRRNPEETKRLLAEKQARARRIRVELQRERLERIARVEEGRVAARQRVESSQTRSDETSRKLQRGEELRAAHLESIQRKAREENLKVEETYRGVRMEQELRRQALQERYELAGQRRQQRLEEIKLRQKEAESREQVARERRSMLEQERLARLEESQQRKEQAQAKIEQERRAALAVLEAKKQQQRQIIENLQREKMEVASRGKVQLEDRLREAETRRLTHIAQIRDKAALSGPNMPSTPTAGAPSIFSGGASAAANATGSAQQDSTAPLAAREGSGGAVAVRRTITYDSVAPDGPMPTVSPQSATQGRIAGASGAGAASNSTPSGGGPDVRSSYVGQIKAIDGTFVTSRTFTARKSSLRERARKILKRLSAVSVELDEPAEAVYALSDPRGQQAYEHASELQRMLSSLLASTTSMGKGGALSAPATPERPSVIKPSPGGSFNVWLASPPPMPLPNSSHHNHHQQQQHGPRTKLKPEAREYVPQVPLTPSAAEAARAAAAALRGIDLNVAVKKKSASPPNESVQSGGVRQQGSEHVKSRFHSKARNASPDYFVYPEDPSDPLDVCGSIRTFIVRGDAYALHATRRSGLLVTLLQACSQPLALLRPLVLTSLLEAGLAALSTDLNVAHAVAKGAAPPAIAATVALLDECLASDALVVLKPVIPSVHSPAGNTPNLVSRQQSLRNTPEPDLLSLATRQAHYSAAAKQLELQLDVCRKLLSCPSPEFVTEELAAVHDYSIAYALARGIIHRIHDVMALLDRPVHGAEVPPYVEKALGVLEALVAPPLSSLVLIDNPPRKSTPGGSVTPAPSTKAGKVHVHQNISGVLVFFQETSLVRLTSMLASLLLQSQNAAANANVTATPPPVPTPGTPMTSPSKPGPTPPSGRPPPTPLSPPSAGGPRSSGGLPRGMSVGPGQSSTPSGMASSTDAASFLPPNFPEVAAAALRVLNRVAELELTAFQDIAGAPDLRIEVYLIIQSLLGLSMQRLEGEVTSDRETVGTSWHALLREVMKLTANFVLQRPSHHQSVQWGKNPTILQNLCALGTVLAKRTRRAASGQINADPVAALIADHGPPSGRTAHQEDMRLLICTLVACCMGSERNSLLLQGEYERGRGAISLKHLQEFLLVVLHAGEGEDNGYSSEPSTPQRFSEGDHSPIPISSPASAFLPFLAKIPRDVIAESARSLGLIRI